MFPFSRREMLGRCGVGMGLLGLQALLGDSGLLAAEVKGDSTNPLAPKAPHFAPKAKRVISPEARAKMAAAAKKRWANAKK